LKIGYSLKDKKRKIVAKQIGYVIAGVFFVLACINFYYNNLAPISYAKDPSIKEEFDPAYERLNTLEAVTLFVDSLYGSSRIHPLDSLEYANLTAHTLRACFYHGLSQYTWHHNWVLALLSPLHPHLMGIVDPVDIIKYPMALCSQQAIIGMVILRSKGYTYRKVGFFNSKEKMGHFTYEIKLRDGWHYYDLDMEPNTQVLERNHRPSIDRLATNDTLRRAAYQDKEIRIKDGLISKYDNHHPENVFPAQNMMALHRATFFLSYFGWLIVLIGMITYSKRKRTTQTYHE
jgi:hypothetical protein